MYHITIHGHLDDYKRVSWSGPTKVFIRSGYHEHQSAYNHALDIAMILRDPRFKQYAQNDNGVKPILVIGGDGGPDEAVKNDKVQNAYLWLMEKHQFDAVYGRNSAPGSSADNRIERTMVILSNAMVAKSLPVFKYGKHLKHGQVVDPELCLKNFNYAGSLLANIFDGLQHNGYPIYAEYLEPLTEEEIKERDKEFLDLNLVHFTTKKHYNASTNLLQMKQCLDPETCSICTKTDYDSNIHQIIPSVFIPPPMVFKNNAAQLEMEDPTKLPQKYHFGGLSLILALNIKIPPSMTMDYFNEQYQDKKKLLKRICPICGVHCSSHAAVLRHRRYHHPRQRAQTDKYNSIEIEIEKLQQLKIKSITNILHFDGNQYLVEFEDGIREYMDLDDDIDLVVEYKKKFKEYHGEVIMADTEEKLMEYYNRDGILRYSDDDIDDIDDLLDQYHINNIADNDNDIMTNKIHRNCRKRTRRERVEEESTDDDDDLQLLKRTRLDNNIKEYESSTDWDEPESDGDQDLTTNANNGKNEN